MILRLFDIYDPYRYYFRLRLNWLLLFFLYLTIFSLYWVLINNLIFIFIEFVMFLFKDFKLFFDSLKLIKGRLIFFISIFLYILILNIMGLMPYYFSVTSHIVFSFFLRFPFWLRFFFFRWWGFTNKTFAHLIPMGTPVFLIPLIVLIETIRNLIRSGSLAVRLVSNIISGHLLISLLGDCGVSILVLHFILFIFEFFVCFIQSYVFSALLTLYSREV